jgi:hypothetical protein
MLGNVFRFPAGCEIFIFFETCEGVWELAFPRPESALKGAWEVCCVAVEPVLFLSSLEGLCWPGCLVGIAVYLSDELSEGCIDLHMSFHGHGRSALAQCDTRQNRPAAGRRVFTNALRALLHQISIGCRREQVNRELNVKINARKQS